MSGLIQRFPSALLPFLQIKSTETPPRLEETVQSGLELAPFYLSDRLEIVTASRIGATAAGNGPTIPVPTGEFWWVISMAVSGQNFSAAGTFVQIGLGIQDRAALTMSLGAMQSIATTVAGQTAIVQTASMPQPVILPSGFQLFGANFAAAGGANSFDIVLRALVCKLTPQ